MRTRATTVTAIVLLLSGCGNENSSRANGVGVSEETELSSALAQALTPQPGQYRMQIALDELKLPQTANSESAQVLKTVQAASRQERTFCLEPQAAERGYRGILDESQQDECRYDHYSFQGGALNVRMTCDGERGQARIAVTGTASRTGSDLTMKVQAGDAADGDVAMSLRVRSERIGDCPA